MVTHVYADNGIYVAKLKVTVNQPGGAVSRHFAIVHVKNVPPVVNAGPDRTVNEGDMVSFAGTFSDVEYPDTHEATWDWGDYQKPEPGIVNETNAPPKAQGKVTGSHAWGDNGTYSVTLTVRDDDGGVGKDQLAVTVLNVPPIVDAGRDMYAYPCTPITLTGNFTDPGWLDTHVGTWEFGDCPPPQPAVIREKNEPPKGVGVAIASHTYEHCGTYNAICTVIDDDGGVGEDTTIIRVIDVQNPGFEHGFRERGPGAVGNFWNPYQAETPVFAAPPAEELDVSKAPEVFFSEEFPVHSGQRSQRIRFQQATRFGLRQQIGANEDWDYQITAWYSRGERSGGVARLGLDPSGGTDSTAASVIWAEGNDRLDWHQLTVRGTAPKAGFITIFLECLGTAAVPCNVCFDDVALVAVQPFCPEEPKAPKPPREKEVCVNFYDLKPGTQLPPVYEKEKFIFEALSKQPLRIVVWGTPAGKSKLQLESMLVIFLPVPSERVGLQMQAASSHVVTAIAFDSGGARVGQVSGTPSPDAQMLQINGRDIVRVEIRGGGGEAVLLEVCVTPDSRKGKDQRSLPAGGPGKAEHLRPETARTSGVLTAGNSLGTDK